MKKETVKFIRISSNEIKFDYKNLRFILEEKGQGVYSMGKAILLFRLNGTTKEFLKTIGWTRSDNYHGEENESNLLNGIVKLDTCQTSALEYVKQLIN